MDSAGERFEAICAALADRNNILTVKDLCELAGVSRSGYYNWVRSEKNRELREAKDREKGTAIKALLKEKGIPEHQYFWWKRKYARAERKEIHFIKRTQR